MPDVVIFGKKGCKLCDACKEKMNLLGVQYQFVDLFEFCGGEWRTNGAVDARVEFEMMQNQTLPLVQIDGKYMLYAESMKLLKERMRTKEEVRAKKKETVQIEMPHLQPAYAIA